MRVSVNTFIQRLFRNRMFWFIQPRKIKTQPAVKTTGIQVLFVK